MINIIITAFNEPKTSRAIEKIISQKINEDWELIVAAPDEATKSIIKDFMKKEKRIKLFNDPGKGKSFALNLLFKELKGDILIFTDGDVFLEENSINEIVNAFKDPKVGCTCGRVVSENSKVSMLGYWSHLLADVGAHRIRQELSDKQQFFECSGYLFAFRSGIIKEIPLDVAEDSIIPYYFFKQNYKVKYVPTAKVYVKNPTVFKDWIKQRKRTASAHTKLTKYEPNLPKMKSFKNELTKGFFSIWSYPSNVKEFIWTINLIFARLYLWTSLAYDEKIKNKYYGDGWARVESTK